MCSWETHIFAYHTSFCWNNVAGHLWSNLQTCKLFWGGKEYECIKCKGTFKLFFFKILGFFMPFGENGSLHFRYWVILIASRTYMASMTSTASTASMASMASSASFHQRNYWAWFFHQPWHQSDLFWSDNVGWIIKNSLFFWFLTPSLLEAVEDRDVTFNQIKVS